MRVRLAVVAAACAAVAGCGNESPSTSLQLVATNPFVGRATFRLECDPAGGDLPDPASACRRLARNPGALLRPKPFVCWGGTASWWNVSVTARHGGTVVERRFRTCWTRQMALVRALGIADELGRHVDPLSRPAQRQLVVR